MPSILVIVRDSNSAVVAGAGVSATGVVQVTDSAGTSTLSLDPTTLGTTVTVTASSSSLVVSGSVLVTQYPATVALVLPPAGQGTSTGGSTVGNSTPSVPVSQNLTLVSSPPGSTVQIGSESGVLGSDGTYTTTSQYNPGSQTATLTPVSGSPTVTAINVIAGQSVYQLAPAATSDAGSGASTQTVSLTGAAAPTSSNPGTVATSNTVPSTGIVPASASAAGSVASAASSNSVPDYEWVNPTMGFGRYFTATQARMYIGNLFIEELAGVQFVLQGNKVPIFGYASEVFDAIANGKTLVQGQIMLHFISEGYLYTVLNEYKRMSKLPGSSAQQTFQQLMTAQLALSSANVVTSDAQNQINILTKQRQALLAADPTLASTYKRLQKSTTASGPNAVYQSVPFDLVLELEGGGRTVTRRITNCILTSNEQIYGDNDGNLLDSYAFIAQRLR
jgi:hypothetical protein